MSGEPLTLVVSCCLVVSSHRQGGWSALKGLFVNSLIMFQSPHLLHCHSFQIRMAACEIKMDTNVGMRAHLDFQKEVLCVYN